MTAHSTIHGILETVRMYITVESRNVVKTLRKKYPIGRIFNAQGNMLMSTIGRKSYKYIWDSLKKYICFSMLGGRSIEFGINKIVWSFLLGGGHKERFIAK